MEIFRGKIGVLTGAGTGIGRALTRQLVAHGCHMAICDVSEEALAETIALCRKSNPEAMLSGILCDVADETQVHQFVDHVRSSHGTGHIDLLINNAGISGGGSFIESSREEWERTFNICWSGVYLMTRAFMPMLLQSPAGHIVNMSSANALRAVLGGHIPHTAYSAAKFAVRGFSEALIHDFRFNAPHLKVSVVMPGAVGTEIVSNSAQILGQRAPEDWSEDDVLRARARWDIAGSIDHADMDDDQVRAAGVREVQAARQVGLSPAEAADIILEGVRNDRWRILVGRDTEALDVLVRENPETAYDPDFVERWRKAYAELTDAAQKNPPGKR